MKNTNNTQDLTYMGFAEYEIEDAPIYILKAHLSPAGAVSIFTAFFGYCLKTSDSKYETNLFVGDVESWLAGEQDDQYMIEHYCVKDLQQKLLAHLPCPTHKRDEKLNWIYKMLVKYDLLK